jgi:hypothetical protein
MEEIISKKELDELIRLKGQIRGAAIREIMSYILKEEGEEGLQKLKDVMSSIGHSINSIRAMSFYSFGLEAATLVAVKRLFGYDDNKFQDLGRFAGKFSIVIRLFMGYLISLDKLLEIVQKMWRKYFTIGNFKVTEVNKQRKYIIVRIENYHLHPIHCQILVGYLSSILQIVVKNKVTAKETKCTFRGDDYQEYLLEW